MKRIIILFACYAAIVCNAQPVKNQTIVVTYNKTTSLVFPYKIKSVDRGSNSILAQAVEGVENVLKVKAGIKHFPETNLTVITEDGAINEITVSYTDQPDRLTYYFNNSFRESQAKFEDRINAAALTKICQRIGSSPNRIVETEKRHKVKLAVTAVVYNDSFTFIKIHAFNSSKIQYEVESLKFYLIDKRQVKRSVSQEIELYPVFACNEIRNLKERSSSNGVYVFPSFIIPDHKELVIELIEKGSGRNLKLAIGPKFTRRAISLK